MTQPTAPDLFVEDYGDTSLAQESVHSCWTCADQRLGGTTFLGNCAWFTRRGEPPKPIPPDIVDRGCAHWRRRTPGPQCARMVHDRSA